MVTAIMHVIFSGRVQNPIPSTHQKFSSTGLVRMEALVDKVRNPETAQSLANKANFGLSGNTWATYQTSVNHLAKCSVETGVDMSLPFDTKKTFEFVGWMEARGLTGKTMSSYLSGVRMYHIAMGYDEPCLRKPVIKLILKGQQNWDNVQKKINGRVGRLPVTIRMMKLLKKNLCKVNWPTTEKRLFWAVATLAWSGSFRIHELCSRVKTEFDPQTTLKWEDIRTDKITVGRGKLDTISVHVKSPKIDRVGNGDNIEVFQLNNFMCPTAALDKYRECSPVKEELGMPVFRLPSGVCFTGEEMNKRLTVLTSCLKDFVLGGEVKSHSFRSGVLSEMARAGNYSEEDLQAVGRWSSQSWKVYCKLPRTKRAMFARNIGQL